MDRRHGQQIQRRTFVAGVAGAAGGLAGCAFRRTGDRSLGSRSTTSSVVPSASANVGDRPTTTARRQPDRVLVVVQLGGGNDGINTVVPITGTYHDRRPTLGLADDTLIAVPGTAAVGLHPSLKPLMPLFEAKRATAIQGVGFTKPSRSHFVALDAWWAAMVEPSSGSPTGWIGRYVDGLGGTDDEPLRAVCLGGGVPALIGRTSHPTVVLSPATFTLPNLPSSFRSAWSSVAGASATSAQGAVTRFAALRDKADHPAADAGNDAAIVSNLATAAELVTSEPSTRVIHVTTGGFDTHSNQLVDHARLLADFAQGVAGFFERIDQAGQSDRVLLMTVSEFGRRAADNGSGTDHGKAGTHFVFGPRTKSAVVGTSDLVVLDDGDVIPTIDTRSYYGEALRWVDADDVQVLGGAVSNVGVFA